MTDSVISKIFVRAFRASFGQASVCVARPWLVFTILFAVDKLALSLKPSVELGPLCRILVVSSAWSALVCSPYLLLGRWARRVYLPLAVLLLASDIVQWHVVSNFGILLSGFWMSLVLGTSPAEIKAYVESFVSLKTCLLLACGLGVVGFLCVFLRPFELRARRVALLFFCGMALGGVGFFAARNPRDLAAPVDFVKSNLACGLFVVDTIDQIPRMTAMFRIQGHPVVGGSPRPSPSAAPVGVFVLGESATRNRWSLYGYGRPTTPAMEAVANELVAFSNLVGVASTTCETMRLLLSEATIDDPVDMRCTLPQALAKAGFECVLLTAQGRMGMWRVLDGATKNMFDGFETLMFGGCSRLRFMADEQQSPYWYDDVLPEALAQELSRPCARPRVFFVHLLGSHFPPVNFVPPDFAPFPHESPEGEGQNDPSRNVNNYDNTIAFTDQVLGRLVGMLKARGGSSWMLYVSDHGESVDSPCFRLPSDPSVWEIPMVFWASDAYKDAHAELMAKARESTDAPLQSDLLFATILRICGVEGYESARPETSFESAPFGFRKVRKICEGAKVYESRR